MNYPYGEHMFFTDGMLPVANTLRILKPVIDLSDYTVAIVNLLMLLSAVFAAVYLFLIFEKLKVNYYLAIFTAIPIVFLSPQWLRITGHFSLSLHFVIPMLIYHLLRYKEIKSWRQVIWMSLITFVLMSMHPYYYPMAAVLLSSFFLTYALFERFNQDKIKKYVLHFLTMLVSPYLLFYTLLNAFDTASNRTSFPKGFWDYQSNLSGLFYPFGKPYENLVASAIEPQEVSWEGVSPVGSFAIVMVVLAIGFLIGKAIKSKGSEWATSPNMKISTFLTISFLFGMMISFAFPFNMGFEEWLDHLGVIKQLRGLGRFAWLCFFAINILAVLALNKFLMMKRYVALGVLLPTLFLLCVDSYYWIRFVPASIGNNNYEWNDLPPDHWSQNINMSDYQCLVPFPYFHVGSENFGAYTPEEFKADVFFTSAYYGIPTTGVNMSRTSLDQTNNLLQLHQYPYRTPDVLDLFDQQKEFLCVFKLPEAGGLMNAYFPTVDPLFANDQVAIYGSTVKDWKARIQMANHEIFNVFSSSPDTSLTDQLFTEDGSHFVFKKDEIVFPLNERKELLIAETEPFSQGIDAVKLQLSFWMKNINQDLMARGKLEITVESEDHHTSHFFGLDGCIAQIDGTNGLFELSFDVPAGSVLTITMFNEDVLEPQEAVVSELLLSKSGSSVLSLTNSSVRINNRTYEK
jgi:hypothetical protein